MELLERLFSLGEKADRLRGRWDAPLVLVSLNGDPMHIPTAGPAGPVLAVAAVLAVALSRAVALQQAALVVVAVLHHVLLPVRPVVVFYHAAEGRNRIISGLPATHLLPELLGGSLGQLQCTTGSWGTSPLPQHPLWGLWSHHFRLTCSKAQWWWGLLRAFLGLLSLQKSPPGTLWGSGHHLPTRSSLGITGSPFGHCPNAGAEWEAGVRSGRRQGRIRMRGAGRRLRGFRRLSTRRRELPGLIQALRPAPQHAVSSALELQAGDG